MKSANINQIHKSVARTKFGTIRLVGLILVLLTLAVATLYSTSLASSPGDVGVAERLSGATGSASGVNAAKAVELIGPANVMRSAGGLDWLPGFTAMPEPPLSGNITLFAADCATPKTTFQPGEVVCATITGIPLVLNIRVDWLGIGNLIQLRGSTLGEDPQNVTFTIPTDAQLGAWQINVTSESDSSVRASEIFYVSNPATPTANLVISKLAKSPQATAGADIGFDVIITNKGPDAAADLVLTDVVPGSTTFVLGTQVSGPTFTCNNPSAGSVGTSSCTLSSLSPGDSAIFLFEYKVDNAASNGTAISNTASVSSTTTDPQTGNNAASASVVVAAQDCVVTCPSNITTQNDPNQFGAIVSYSVPTGAGACGTISSSPASGTFFPVGTTVVVAAGDTGNGCSFTITVNDTQAPAFASCPTDITVNENPSGSGGATVNYSNPTATDNDPAGAVVTCDHPSGETFPVGTTPVTCTATDAAGNSTNSCTFNVIVQTLCGINCPSNITKNVDAGTCGAVVTYDAPTTSNCSGTETVTQIGGLPSGSTFPVGTTTNTFKVTDGSSTSTCSFTVTVADNEMPSITCPADINVATTGNSCEKLVSVTPPSATDNCSHPPTVIGVRDDGDQLGDAYPVGTTIITWTATDASGNKASCEQKVFVHDNTAPTASVNVPDTVVAALMNANADDNCLAPVPDLTAYLTAFDNCVAHLTVVQTPTGDSGIGDSLVGPGAHPITIKVSDVDPSEPDSPTPNTTTLTKMNIVHVQLDSNGDPVLDSNGNPVVTIVSTVDMIFTVVDVTPPTITAPAAVTAYTGPGATSCGTTVNNTTLGTPTGTDNCQTVTFTRSPSGNTFPVGTTTITWTAHDGAGNTASATQNVTVIDDTPPTISCPTDIVVDFDPVSNGAIVNYTAPVGSDNCPGATTSRTAGLASGSIFPLGTTTNTFTVVDAAGNTTSCSFKVTVALTSLIGLDSVTMTGSGYADSYSSSGGYPATKGSLVNILSNGTITMGNSAKVWGNVRSTRANVNMTGASQVTGNATAGTTVTTSGSAVVLGTRTNNALAPVMTLPSVPACSPFSSNSGISGTYTYNAGTGDLTVNGINIATLANGNYCFHNITLGNSGQLKVNGPVLIKLTGTLNTSGASNLNNTTQIPSNLEILSSYTGSNGVVIGNGVSIYALIYSPQTGLNMSGAAPLFGTAAAKTLTIGNGGAIHYDTQLKNAWPAVWAAIFGP